MEAPKNDIPVANLEAERQLLGRLLLENGVYWEVAQFLRPEHFSHQIHEDLYRHIGELVQNNELANPVTLQSYVRYKINRAPAVRYYLALSRDATHAVNVGFYARTIVALALRRNMISGAHAIIDQSETLEVSTPVEKILESADALFSSIRFSIPGAMRDTTSIAAVCDESFSELLKLVENPVSPYPTMGVSGVTRLMGPLTPGCVYIIAGRPGSGKTAAAVAAARSIIRQTNQQGQNFGVAFFTLEVPKRDLWNRFIACEMAISHNPVAYMDLKRGNVTAAQLKSIEHHSKALKRFPLSIDDKSGLTVAEIFVRARAEKQKLAKIGVSLSVVVVDYLQIIKPAGRYHGNKVAEISDISSALVTLAKDLDVAVIAVSQLSRKVEERNDKRPIMSDLRESGQIEQDANSIIFLYRPAYYDNQQTAFADAELLDKFQARENDLHYIVAKARDGLTGEVVAKCDIGKNYIYY